MKKPQKSTTEEWLDLLKEALDHGESVKPNHRYTFKGQRLGTFLVGVKKRDNEALKAKIKALGLDLERTDRTVENATKRLIRSLENDMERPKTRFQTVFNKTILPRQEELSPVLKDKLDTVWKNRFEEERSWEKPLTTLDRVVLWRDFRYDLDRNPEQKWFQGAAKMGDLYTWVYKLRKNRKKTNSIIGVFGEKEQKELREEGFPVE